MRVDRIVVDALRSLKQVLQTLDNNVTVQDNFGASGADEGSVIVSVGRIKIPVWKKLSDLITGGTGTTVTQNGGVVVVTGPQGPAGPAGPPGADGMDASEVGQWEPLAFDSEVVFDADGDCMMFWVHA